MAVGEQAVIFISNNFEWLTVLMGVLVIAGYVLYTKRKSLGQMLSRWGTAVRAVLRKSA